MVCWKTNRMNQLPGIIFFHNDYLSVKHFPKSENYQERQILFNILVLFMETNHHGLNIKFVFKKTHVLHIRYVPNNLILKYVLGIVMKLLNLKTKFMSLVVEQH